MNAISMTRRKPDGLSESSSGNANAGFHVYGGISFCMMLRELDLTKCQPSQEIAPEKSEILITKS